MFSTICLIFVSLVMSTNAGGPNHCTVDDGDSNLKQLEFIISDFSGHVQQAIVDYIRINLSQPEDELKRNIQKIVNENYNNLKGFASFYIERLMNDLPGRYHISCFDKIKSKVDNIYNSLSAFANYIISQKDNIFD